MIGAGLSRLLGWKADLRNPKLEVNFKIVLKIYGFIVSTLFKM